MVQFYKGVHYKHSHSVSVLISEVILFTCVSPPPTGDIMVFHPEFEHAGKKAGLQVWRVENMELVPVPESLYGGFYCGDAYLVLHSTETQRGTLQYDLHYWICTRVQHILMLVHP